MILKALTFGLIAILLSESATIQENDQTSNQCQCQDNKDRIDALESTVALLRRDLACQSCSREGSYLCGTNGDCYCKPGFVGPKCDTLANGELGEWSAWSQCSTTCGQGTQRRMRKCLGPNDCEDEGRTVPYGGGYMDVKECEGNPACPCKIKKEQCKFPSESDYFTECKNDAAICACSGNLACSKCPNYEQDPDTMYFCEAKMSDLDPKYEYMSRPWVKCSNDCFDGSEAKTFGEDETCNAEEVECIFPFKYTTLGEEKTAENCTNDVIYEDENKPGKTKEDFYWCATRVNADNVTMKKGKWARCETSTCKWNPGPGGNSGGLGGGGIAGIIICILALLGIAGGGTWYSKKENKFCFAHQNQGAVQVPMS